MKTLGLYKKEKLCSARAIDQLFGPGGADFTRLAYPLRLVARRNPSRHSDAPVAFLISIPKKRLHHAVDRVLMRRRTREAYRLTHREYPLEAGIRLDAAFIYVADKTVAYYKVERAMRRLLGALSDAFPAAEPTAPIHTDSHDQA
ncbi:MAG: ribonuclease P protein component [Muribaculaceae bacterium]|nr:ribonuclease P protein component [Muribaculaceae bacterium]